MATTNTRYRVCVTSIDLNNAQRNQLFKMNTKTEESANKWVDELGAQINQNSYLSSNWGQKRKQLVQEAKNNPNTVIRIAVETISTGKNKVVA